jgi:hypothetical protein
MNQPQIQKGQWIKVGENEIDGYVIDVYSDGSLGVGYYQNRIKAIKEEVVWDGARWKFKNVGPNGSYLRNPEAAIVKRGP